ncbi:hypothetical protein GF336_02985 [Candidatus Woesearchaeota archaeon]|nr:hypothetical protein [Candidatus Woesearchaeota archaeon]
MKWRLLFLFFALCIFINDTSAVEINNYVNDYAEIIDDTTEDELNSILKQIHESGESEYSIVTIDSLEGVSIESYSLDLAQGNLGDSEKNNGLLLLIAVEDRKYRFEVGRGIEYILNDAKVGRIGRVYLKPNFQAEQYSKGILEASLAVRSVLLGDETSDYYVTGNEVDTAVIANWTPVMLFIIFFVIFPLLGAIFKKKKSDNKYFNAAMGAVILFGGPRGGSRGGGFGGFGGGGFGGGGASSGW